jgi:hypothetical protein
MLGPSRASGKHMGTDQTGTPIRWLRFVRVLSSRDVDAVLDGRLGLAHRPGAGEQCLAPEPIELGFKQQRAPVFSFSPNETKLASLNPELPFHAFCSRLDFIAHVGSLGRSP